MKIIDRKEHKKIMDESNFSSLKKNNDPRILKEWGKLKSKLDFYY